MLSYIRNPVMNRSIASSVSSFSTFNFLLKAATKTKATKTTKKTTKKAAKATKEAKPTAKELKKKAKLPYKGSVSSFVFFNKEYYSKHSESLKGRSMADRSHEVSEAWKNLSDAEKIPYNELALKDHDRYTAEKAKYEASLPPKRPVSGFISYYSSIRPDLIAVNPSLSISELAKLAGEKWRALSESEREEIKSAARVNIEAWKKQYGSEAKK